MLRNGGFPAHRSLHGAKMSKEPVTKKAEAEKVVKDIRRATRKIHSAEEKIRIVLAGLRGEDSIAELCRREVTVWPDRPASWRECGIVSSIDSGH